MLFCNVAPLLASSYIGSSLMAVIEHEILCIVSWWHTASIKASMAHYVSSVFLHLVRLAVYCDDDSRRLCVAVVMVKCCLHSNSDRFCCTCTVFVVFAAVVVVMLLMLAGADERSYDSV